VSYRDAVKFDLRRDEGVRNRPYLDTEGKLTIGIGRNLDDVGVHDDEIELMCNNDLDEAERTARRLVSNFHELDDARKAVLLNMSFNLGYNRLKGFKNMLAAVGRKDWAAASIEMMNSKWAVQVGHRAVRLAYQMRKGKL
jgi:lysozyme